MKLFAVHSRRHSDVFALWGLWKNFWTHFHDLCVQERSCFPWSSDAVWKFSALKFCRKSSGRIFTIYASKTKLFSVKFSRLLEVLCVQGSQKKCWAQFHDLCIQKRSCFPWNSDAFWKFSACKVHTKSFGRNFTIYASKNEAVFREIQTHVRSSLPAKFT